MKLSIAGKLLLGLALLSTTVAFAANKGSLVVVGDAVTVNGHQLAPGAYQLKWDGTGSTVELSIFSNGKLVATVPAHVLQRDKGSPYDAYDMHKNNDGTLSLTQVKFGGKKYTLAFGDDTAASTSVPKKDNNPPASN